MSPWSTRRSRLRGSWQLPRGSEFPFGGRAAEPVREMRRSEKRMIARCEALIVNRDAVVAYARVRGHGPRVIGCVDELPGRYVETHRFGTGDFDHSIHR